MRISTNRFEALCAFLELAITTESEKKSREYVLVCEDIAKGMTEAEVERAKRTVTARLKDN